MSRRWVPVFMLAMFLFPMLFAPQPAAAAAVPMINEFVFNHAGTDTNEYVEIFGDANTDYSAFTIIDIEGDGAGAGVIDSVLPVGSTGGEGLWASGFLANEFENGTLTLLLVEGFTGAAGDDLDTDNDGVPDVTPWAQIADSVAVSDAGAGDLTYADVVLAPDFDGGGFTVGGASRIPNGTDTNAAADWVRNDFDLAGVPGFPGTPQTGEALNTPDALNDVVVPDEATIATIMEIQGSEQFSPLAGARVETTGVVTLITANGEHCWIQDATGDGSAETSEGIFVNGCGTAPGGIVPQVGDQVSVVAFVEEQQFAPALPLTRLTNVETLEVLSSDNPLPEPVELVDLPDVSIPDAIAFWEPLEGMLVSVSNAPVVAPTNSFGEFTVLTRKDAKPGSGFYPQTQQILLNSIGENEVDYNPERIIVDDSSLEDPVIVMPGDRVRSLVGAVDFTFGNYKIQPASIDVKTHRLPRVPVSKRDGEKGDVAITSFNVENLFDLEDNPDKDDESSTPSPEELEIQLSKLALAIQLELELPEILVVQEVENTAILQELGNRVNTAADTDYVATSFESSDARGIENGFLWDANRVSLLQAYPMTGADVEAAFGPTSESPGREPIVGIFNLSDNLLDPPLIIIGNHFKSKSGDDALFSVNWPPVRSTEVQRKMQAQVVADFVSETLAGDPNALVMVAGDLNDFQFGEPGEGPDHTLAILESAGLTNLVFEEKEAERFSYVFDGNSQVLDHMLVSPGLFELFASVNFLHFDASFPAILESDPETPIQASDHDPIEGRFNLEGMQAKVDYTLTVLHNNDGESNLLPGDDGFGGVANFATVVDELRAEGETGDNRDVLMLSSGDNFLAGPEFNVSQEKGVPFYDTIAMRLIGYDAAAIGNHEFDFGPDVLAEFIEGFEGTLPFVSANLDFTGEPNLQALVDQGIIVKRTVLEMSGEQIGIVGATTPLLRFISSPRNVTVDPNVAEAIQGQIDELLAMGINKIIVISHLQSIEEDLALAPMLSGVDVMIAGGGDEVLANEGDLLLPDDVPYGPYPLLAVGGDGNTIPVVTTAGNYNYVGRLIVGFDRQGEVTAIDIASGPVRVAFGDNPDAVTPDPEVQAQVVEPLEAALADLAATVVANSEVPLNGLRAAVRTQETNLGNLIADSLLWQATELAGDFGVNPPDVALQNGGGIRNDSILPAGPITALDTFSVLPFANFVSIVPDIPREQFKDLLENAISRVEFTDGRFAQIAGFSYVYDPTAPARTLDEEGNVIQEGQRVLEVVLDDGTTIVSGGAVVPGDPINIATIDFLANGGDQYPYNGAPFTTLGVTYQQALENYLVTGLSGQVTAAEYPEGGEGRVTTGP